MLALKVRLEVRADRDAAAVAPGSLALVPLAQQGQALAVRSSDFDDVLKRVQAQVAAHRYVQRQARESDANQLVQWMADDGRKVCTDALVAIPSLQVDVSHLHPKPMGADLVWLTVCSPAAQLLPQLIAHQRNEIQRGLLDEAKKHWVAKHITLCHETLAPLGREDHSRGRYKKPTCIDAGHCLCDDKGMELWRMYKRVVTSLRTAMREKNMKSLIQEGFAVLNVTALTVDALADIDDGDVMPGDLSSDMLHPAAFVHIGLLYESPTRPSLRSCRSRNISTIADFVMHLARFNVSCKESYPPHPPSRTYDFLFP